MVLRQPVHGAAEKVGRQKEKIVGSVSWVLKSKMTEINRNEASLVGREKHFRGM
jgi:hypothetical protein